MATPLHDHAIRWALRAGLALAAASPSLAQSGAPEGDGCAGAIARWEEFSGSESRGGHMDASVYDKIQDEIDRASHLCEAGQDAQARRLVAESRRRHGY